jgi:hypothetical protein
MAIGMLRRVCVRSSLENQNIVTTMASDARRISRRASPRGTTKVTSPSSMPSVASPKPQCQPFVSPM